LGKLSNIFDILALYEIKKGEMLRMKSYVLIFLSLICFQVSFAESLPANIPASANILGRLDLKSVINKEPILKLKKAHPKYKEFLEKLKKGASFDFEKADSIWFVGKNVKEGFFILKGDFNADDIISTLVLNGDVEMLKRKGCRFAAMFPSEDGKKFRNIGAVIDDKTIVFGRESEVEDYLLAAQEKKPFLSRKKYKEASRYFKDKSNLKIVLLKYILPADNPASVAIKNNLKSTILDYDLEKDLDIRLALVFKSEQAAVNFQKIFEVILMNELSKTQGSKLAGMIRSELKTHLKFKSDGDSLKAESKISGEKLDELLSFFLLRKEGMNRRRENEIN
jgi:hypothetical protein